MIVVDEYLAVRAVAGDSPEDLPDEPLALPATRYWRLLQRIHAPAEGQLSRILAELFPSDRDALRRPDPEFLQILDPRPLLDDAAIIAAHYGSTGLPVAETVAAGLQYGENLWFGTERNVGLRRAEIAQDLDITIHVIN